MNNPLLLASTEADAAAASAIEQHHAQLAGTLAARVEAVLDPVARLDGKGADEAATARELLVAWARAELVPHARAEEEVLYPAAHDRSEARLLVEAMLAEHELLIDLVHDVADADNVVRAGAAARALLELFNAHLAKENDLLVPLLAGAPDVALSDLVRSMHAHLDAGTDDATHAESHAESHADSHAEGDVTEGVATTACGGHTCTCGEMDGPGLPELDARTIPHAIRHATIFGALDTVEQSGGLVLVAPHDPLPLLGQVEQRYAGAFEVEYLERGPEVWRLAFIRRAA
jgi:uncharacterized protein (DUF2249 family)/iron-sulfur cluster repair protein YtfE (RIC family)